MRPAVTPGWEWPAEIPVPSGRWKSHRLTVARNSSLVMKDQTLGTVYPPGSGTWWPSIASEKCPAKQRKSMKNSPA